MGNIDVNTTRKEKDLRVALSANFKMSEQHGIVALKAEEVHGLFRENVIRKEEGIIIPLYKSRPCLEYCIQAWQPYPKKV